MGNTSVYTLMAAFKYDMYDMPCVGVFSSMENAVSHARKLVTQDAHDRFCVLRYEMDQLDDSSEVTTFVVGHEYSVQVTHKDLKNQFVVTVTTPEQAIVNARQLMVDYYAAQGVRVFKKHMVVQVLEKSAQGVLITVE